MIDMTDLFVSLWTRAQFSISPVRCETGVLTHKQTPQVRTKLFVWWHSRHYRNKHSGLFREYRSVGILYI